MQKGKNFILPGYKPLHLSIHDSIELNNNAGDNNNNAGDGVGIFIDENYDFEPIN